MTGELADALKVDVATYLPSLAWRRIPQLHAEKQLTKVGFRATGFGLQRCANTIRMRKS